MEFLVKVNTVATFNIAQLCSIKMLQTKNRFFGNIVGHVDGITDVRSLASWTAEQFDPQLDWKEIDWIKLNEFKNN